MIIYSGATILGRTRLGRGSIIGANAWVTRDVEPGAIVTRYHGEQDDLRSARRPPPAAAAAVYVVG